MYNQFKNQIFIELILCFCIFLIDFIKNSKIRPITNYVKENDINEIITPIHFIPLKNRSTLISRRLGKYEQNK